MRQILLAVLATVGLASASDLGKCQKNCGIDFGKCLVTRFDMKGCLKEEASCALDCFKSVHAQIAKVRSTPMVKNIGVCQKNCGIDFGKCLITRFDMKACLKEEAACALDCLKGVPALESAHVSDHDDWWDVQDHDDWWDVKGDDWWDVQDHDDWWDVKGDDWWDVQDHDDWWDVKESELGKCQKNCGIEFGKCLINTMEFKSCLKAQANCALDCFKSLKVKTTVSKAQVKNMAECQKNCGIDFGKCLITTFDMKECLKTQAACALDCLKSVKKSFL